MAKTQLILCIFLEQLRYNSVAVLAGAGRVQHSWHKNVKTMCFQGQQQVSLRTVVTCLFAHNQADLERV